MMKEQTMDQYVLQDMEVHVRIVQLAVKYSQLMDQHVETD